MLSFCILGIHIKIACIGAKPLLHLNKHIIIDPNKFKWRRSKKDRDQRKIKCIKQCIHYSNKHKLK